MRGSFEFACHGCRLHISGVPDLDHLIELTNLHKAWHSAPSADENR